MALFKIFKGLSSNFDESKVPLHDGYAYFTPDNGLFYIDAEVDGSAKRICINKTQITTKEGPFTVAQGTATTECAQQEWDAEGKYLHYFDVEITGIKSTSRVSNVSCKQNSAFDKIAQNYESIDGALRFYTEEATLSAEFKIYNFDVSANN